MYDYKSLLLVKCFYRSLFLLFSQVYDFYIVTEYSLWSLSGQRPWNKRLLFPDFSFYESEDVFDLFQRYNIEVCTYHFYILSIHIIFIYWSIVKPLTVGTWLIVQICRFLQSIVTLWMISQCILQLIF